MSSNGINSFLKVKRAPKITISWSTKDRHMSIWMIAGTVNANKETFRKMLHKTLNMKKVCVKLVQADLSKNLLRCWRAFFLSPAATLLAGPRSQKGSVARVEPRGGGVASRCRSCGSYLLPSASLELPFSITLGWGGVVLCFIYAVFWTWIPCVWVLLSGICNDTAIARPWKISQGQSARGATFV